MNELSKDEQIIRLNERVKVRIAPSKIHGVGIFALRDIAKGQKIYADRMPEVYSVRYADFNKLFPEVRNLLLERWPGIAVGWKFAYPDTRLQAYMNHSDEPNYDPFKDETLKDIKQGEELTEDYRRLQGYQQVFPWLLDKKGSTLSV